uniref:Uncharacterized protein n=1 Tax=Cacopsylla melanoneura TaxID=428564 RepID=A0A8D8ZEG7_9HEMI
MRGQIQIRYSALVGLRIHTPWIWIIRSQSRGLESELKSCSFCAHKCACNTHCTTTNIILTTTDGTHFLKISVHIFDTAPKRVFIFKLGNYIWKWNWFFFSSSKFIKASLVNKISLGSLNLILNGEEHALILSL